MSDHPSEFLLLSRGQWDPTLPPERIQTAIDDFYVWLDQMVADGKMKKGVRLSQIGKTVGRDFVTDGPFGETKEAVGGYWFIVASGIDEAIALARTSPCVACGLFYEIRLLEHERATAYRPSTETPDDRRGR